METMFSEGWTTGSQLFLGAKACADWVKVNGGDNGPALNTDTMQPRCISNIQVCVWDPSCQAMDHTCEFTDEYGAACKTNGNYLEQSCPDSGYSISSVKVPAAYTGPLDTTTDDDISVCH